MNTHHIALQLMAAQGILGAFDTLYHHELTESLPQKKSARQELSIHAARALIYSCLFIGLAAWEWHGIWAAVLMLVFGVEIVLTLWDFVIEDQTRLLPATERITHTILAINGGAFISLLALNAPAWLAQSTALVFQPYGALSIFLGLCGIGVGLSGIRDGFAAYQFYKNTAESLHLAAIHFSDQSKTVLVTGGTGFIGQLLVRALLADRQRVILLTRNPKKAAWTFDGKVSCISTMRDLPGNHPVDVIINLAGAPVLGRRWTAPRKLALRQSRIALTNSIIEWIKNAEQKPKLFLSASAIGYYGVQKQGDDTALTEESIGQDIFMSQLCQEWEKAAQEATKYKVCVLRMRIGLVLGNQGALPMMLLPIKLGLGGSLGSGRQWQSWIHVQDVLRGIAHLWQLHTQEDARLKNDDVFNFVAPQSVQQKKFIETAARLMHRPCFTPIPGFPVRLALGEQADLLLEGQRVSPERLGMLGFTFSYSNLEEALRSLL